MKILVLSDIHGKTIEKANDIADNYDLTLIAGDITHFGGYGDAMEILKTFIKDRTVFAVYGNCDNSHVGNCLDDLGINVHQCKKSFEDISIGGFSGAPTSRFETPGEFPETEIARGLKYVKGCDILLTHAPAYGCALDMAPVGHIGSESIRKAIVNYAPRLHVCGHVHEARGTDSLSKTLLVNPGPYFSGYYAEIDYGENIDIRLMEF